MRDSRVRRQCLEILQRIVIAGHTKEFTSEILETAIMLHRGGDPRTIKNWTNNMLRMNLITRVPRPIAIIYELNLQSCPELLNDLLKPGQKKLM